MQGGKYRICWRETGEREACVMRMCGDSPYAVIPETLRGRKVTRLADYCFAKDAHFEKSRCLVESSGADDEVRELGGAYLLEAVLPDSLSEVGNYCFYNCAKLEKLEIGSRLGGIGSDAFMNCQKLRRLFLRCGCMEPSGLSRILSRIPWDLEVTFLPSPHRTEAVLFYPEYTESYDEIAPAHLFGRSISGEGFRARQCFRDGVLDFARYDAVFAQACAEETAATLCRFAFDRLRFPVGLCGQAREQYERYLRAHAHTLLKELVGSRAFDAVAFLYESDLLETKDAAEGIVLASAAGWTEGSVCMQRLLQARADAGGKDRYAFDDF